MGIFGSFEKAKSKDHVDATAPSERRTSSETPVAQPSPAIAEPSSRRRSERTKVYSVRVRDSFKGQMLSLLAEQQLEQHRLATTARRITEGELIELMLDSFKSTRGSGTPGGRAMPLTLEVWQAVHEIALHQDVSPAEVVEQLVVQKVAELGLFPRKSE